MSEFTMALFAFALIALGFGGVLLGRSIEAAATALAGAWIYSAKARAGIVRPKERAAEKSDLEKREDGVRAFLRAGVARFTADDVNEILWAYARLNGEDTSQGSVERAQAILRTWGLPDVPPTA